jgi:hypothetical protein
MHMLHMPIGQPNCCAFIELFPSHESFNDIKGHGNMARHLGIHYYHHNVNNNPTESGTIVNSEDIISIIEVALSDIRNKPTCLNDAKDTRLISI